MKPLAIAYALLALAGLGTALWCGVPYWSAPGASVSGFTSLAFANAPAATLGADLGVVYVLGNLFIVVEGRRLRMPRLWLYVLANTFIAVAVGLSLFLLARERRA